jgi:hypothetical protein
VAAAGADHGVARCGACGAAFGNVEVEPAVVLEEFGTLEAGAFHARGRRDGPGLEDGAGRHFHGQSIRIEFGHLSAGHVKKAAPILGDVSGVDGVDAEIDRLGPRAARVVGVNHPQTAVGGKVDVELALIFAKVGRVDVAVITGQGGSHRTPVNQVVRVPDEQAGRVIEAGMGEIEVIAHADGAGVGVIAAEDGIAIDAGGLRVDEAVIGGKNECGGGRVNHEASAGEHGRASVAFRSP